MLNLKFLYGEGKLHSCIDLLVLCEALSELAPVKKRNNTKGEKCLADLLNVCQWTIYMTGHSEAHTLPVAVTRKRGPHGTAHLRASPL